MQRDDERDDGQNLDEAETIEQSDEITDTSSPDDDAQAAELRDVADASGGERTLSEELSAMREAEANRENATDMEGDEASAATPLLDDAGAPVRPMASGEPSVSTSDSPASSAAGDVAPPPTLSFLGPITRLDELPQHDIEHLDEETAANLVDAIRNPEKFGPGYLDRTTIRNLFSTVPSRPDEPGDAERPWYDSQLPPLRLEVTLLKYDWMVDKAIERAAGRIDRVTDQKIDGKVNSAKFELRNEIRNLLR